MLTKVYWYLQVLTQNWKTWAGLPLGQEKSGNQEKSGKLKKNYKNQEKSENLIKFKKSEIFSF